MSAGLGDVAHGAAILGMRREPRCLLDCAADSRFLASSWTQGPWRLTVEHAQVKENVPQAKQAEKQVTNPAGSAKQADAKVKEAVPQAKQAESVATGKSGGFSFDLGGVFGGSTADTAKNADSKVRSRQAAD